MNLNRKKLLLLIVVMYCISIFLTTFLLNTKELLNNFYSEQLAKNQFEKLVESQQKGA